MSIELEEVKKRIESPKDHFDGDDDFGKYTKIYMHSNENLKEYITDLQSKRVLTVGASGDHLFSAIMAGSSNVDIFDINKYALMFIELRIYALKYLKSEDVLRFFTFLDVESYLMFNDYLPDHLKEFFDYIFLYCDRENINERFFQDSQQVLNNTSYQNTKDIKVLQELINYNNGTSINCNMYSLPKFVEGKYDVIYLSNIMAYEKRYDRMFKFIRMLMNCYLNDGGEIYYDYVWTIKKDADKKVFFNRQDKVSIDDETIEEFKDIYEPTEAIVLDPVHDNHFNGSRSFNDVVLRIKK